VQNLQMLRSQNGVGVYSAKAGVEVAWASTFAARPAQS